VTGGQEMKTMGIFCLLALQPKPGLGRLIVEV